MPSHHRSEAAIAARRAEDLRRQKYNKYQRPRKERRRELIRRIRLVKCYKAARQKYSERTAVLVTANRFGVSLCTVRNYYRIYMKHGNSGLIPRSKAPRRAHQRLSGEAHRMIATIRTLTGWGPKRISVCMRKELRIKVSHTTVWKTLKRYHIKTRTYHPRGKSLGIAYRRYQRSHPNSLWHIDFKASEKLILGFKINIIVIVDDSSRYCLFHKVIVGTPCLVHVLDALSECFDKYGKPKAILTDNASVFIGLINIHKDPTVLSGFQEFLAKRKIQHITTAPHYPQTNGKVEAFIKTMLAECLGATLAYRNKGHFAGLEELEDVLREYIHYYNCYRPHSSLGYETPIYRFAGCRLASTGFATTPLLKDIYFGHEKGWVDPPRLTPEYIACRLKYLDTSKSCQRSILSRCHTELSNVC